MRKSKSFFEAKLARGGLHAPCQIQEGQKSNHWPVSVFHAHG